jgi:hypothetical protein
LEEGMKIEDRGRIYRIDSIEAVPMAASMVAPDMVTGPFSMTPNDVWTSVDGGKPIGNEHKFPLDGARQQEKAIIKEVNMNRNDITNLAASELLRIAKDLQAEDEYRQEIDKLMMFASKLASAGKRISIGIKNLREALDGEPHPNVLYYIENAASTDDLNRIAKLGEELKEHLELLKKKVAK